MAGEAPIPVPNSGVDTSQYQFFPFKVARLRIFHFFFVLLPKTKERHYFKLKPCGLVCACFTKLSKAVRTFLLSSLSEVLWFFYVGNTYLNTKLLLRTVKPTHTVLVKHCVALCVEFSVARENIAIISFFI